MSVDFSKRLVGAVGALTVGALTATALGVFAPAAASSAALTYTCISPGFAGPKQFTMVADTDAPGRIAYGETVTPTATGRVTVPEDVTTTIRDGLMAKKVDGKADVAATVDNETRPWDLAIGQTNVPPKGTMTLEGTGSAGEFRGTEVRRVYNVAVGDFTATLNFYNANGTPAAPSTTVVCTLNAGQNAAVDTVKVVKDKTTTAVTARDIRKGQKAKAKIKVTSDFGLTTKGKLKVKLLRNGKKLKSKQVYLRDGQRKVKFVRVRNTSGDYAIKAKYVGHPNFRGSSARDPFTVG